MTYTKKYYQNQYVKYIYNSTMLYKININPKVRKKVTKINSKNPDNDMSVSYYTVVS